MPLNPPAPVSRTEEVVSEIQAKVYFNRRPIALTMALLAGGAAGLISPFAILPVLVAIYAGMLYR